MTQRINYNPISKEKMKELIALCGLLIAFVGLLLVDLDSSPKKAEVTHKATKAKVKSSIEEKPTSLYGLDISHYQGDLIKDLGPSSHLTFVIVKSTQGAYYLDPNFHSNWKAIKNKGLIRGTYHFYIAKDDPIEQAEHFFKAVGKLNQNDIAPIVDIETLSLSGKPAPKNMTQEFKRFLKHAEAQFGRKLFIYTSYGFAQEYLKDTALASHPLWLAEYSGDKEPKLPDLWKKIGYKIWQKNDTHQIDSIDTDFDQFYGLKSELLN